MKGFAEDDMKLDDNEAMEFHYFKLHDYDNNNKLDGLELGAAMTHYHETNNEGQEKVQVRSLILVKGFTQNKLL